MVVIWWMVLSFCSSLGMPPRNSSSAMTEMKGSFLTYSEVMFRAPVYAGDFIEVRGRLTEVGNTSRKMEFRAVKQITRPQDADLPPSAMDVLSEPVVVAEAKGVCVVPKERQRRGNSSV